MTQKRWFLLGQVLVGVTVATFIIYKFMQHKKPLELRGTVYDQPITVPDIDLTDHNGQELNIEDFQGKWVVMFFGFTHCPDICPTSLAYIAKEYDRLREFRRQAAVVFVSVDPERDRPEKLRDYVTYFHPDLVGATTDIQNMFKFTKPLGVFFERERETEPGKYLVSHSADFFLIDPQGRLKAVYRSPHEPGTIAKDLRYLITRGHSS